MTADLCFRDLEEAWPGDLWKRFQDGCLPGAQACAVVTEPALGGVIFSTPRRASALDTVVCAMPGVGFRVVPPDGAPPSSGFGLLQLDAEGAGSPYVLLSSLGGERYRYLGTSRLRRSGCVFPRDVVIEAAQALPGVLAATVVALPAGGEGGGSCFGLMVFVRAPSSWSAEREARVRRALESFLSEVLAPEVRPDFVECHPLWPPRDEGGTVDAGWAAEQRARGTLKRKSGSFLFRQLARLHEGDA